MAGKQYSTVDLVLLGMVLEQPRSAYEIQKQVEFRHLDRWVRMSIPSVHKKVARLEQQGYFTSEPVREGKSEKTVYTITPDGEAHLHMLMAGIAAAPAQVLFDFNAVIANVNKIPLAEARALLADIHASIAGALAYIQGMQPQRTHVPLVARTILSQQVYVLEALERWITDFTAEFIAEQACAPNTTEAEKE